jgi:hypothetical protein
MLAHVARGRVFPPSALATKQELPCQFPKLVSQNFAHVYYQLTFEGVANNEREMSTAKRLHQHAHVSAIDTALIYAAITDGFKAITDGPTASQSPLTCRASFL